MRGVIRQDLPSLSLSLPISLSLSLLPFMLFMFIFMFMLVRAGELISPFLAFDAAGGCGLLLLLLLFPLLLGMTYGLLRSIGGSSSRLMRSVQSRSSKKGCCFRAATPPMTNIVPRDAPRRLVL